VADHGDGNVISSKMKQIFAEILQVCRSCLTSDFYKVNVKENTFNLKIMKFIEKE